MRLHALTHMGGIDHAADPVATDPRRAHIDRLDQQVTEHPVGVRHAGLRDSLHGIVNDGGRRLPAETLVGGPYPAGELVGPLGGLRNLRQG